VSANWTGTKTRLAGETPAEWIACMIPANVPGEADLQVSEAKKAAPLALADGGSIWSGGEMKHCLSCANINIL